MTSIQTHEISPKEASAVATVRGELRRLHAMDPSSAHLLESLAFVLTRVANADHCINDSETLQMEEILMRLAQLPPAQAVLAVEIAKQRTRFVGCSGNYSVSRSLRRQTDPKQRLDLLRSLIEVAVADGDLCDLEVEAIERIAIELGFSRELACELLTDKADLQA
ncbi:MAG: TerB family tellurite resistance protein [Thermoanaerobaculales bacterium]|nr:TerB family tellurite resistance protein [Thermoanaerobaculales bacterium]